MCVIDIFSKYAWAVPLKEKKVLVLLMLLKKYEKIQIENQTKCGLLKKVNFYNNSFKKWLKDKDNEMHLIHNKEKSVGTEKFIRTIKTKI